MIRDKETLHNSADCVCTLEFMDGARQTDGSAGMSASETRGNAPQGLKNSPMGARNGAAFESLSVKSRHLETTDSLPQLAASYSDHP